MSTRKIFICATLVLSLSGCSKFLDGFSRLKGGGNALVRFANGKRMLGPPLSNGVVVYVNKIDDSGNMIGTETLKLSSDTDTTAFSIDAGKYVFAAVGFPAGANALAQVPRCGVSAPYSLAGAAAGSAPVEIELSMDTGSCRGGVFHDSTNFGSAQIDPLNFTFCDGQASMNTFAAVTDSCATARIQSPSFKAGGSPVGTETEHTQFDTVTNRFAYIADTYGAKELFSVKRNGTGVVRQNSILGNVGGREVKDYEIVYDKTVPVGKGIALYTSDEEHTNNDVYQLYVTTIGVPGGTRLHSAASNSISPGNGGVTSFRITEDGHYAVFVARLGVSTTYELYAVDLTAGSLGPSSAVKISHASPAGFGMIAPVNGADWDYKILPDNQTVAFAGKFVSSSQSELFLINIADKITNSGLAPTKISHTALVDTNYNVRELRLSRNGNRLFWTANPCISTCPAVERRLIWGTDVSTPASPGSPVKISRLFPSTDPTADVPGGYWVSDVSDKLVFTANISSGTDTQLWEIDFSTWGTFSSALLDSETLASNMNFGFVRYSPLGTKVVYLKGTTAPAVTPSDHKIFAVSSGGGTVLTITPNLITGIPINFGGGHDQVYEILDENRVIFISDLLPSSPKRLRQTKMDGSSYEQDITAFGGTAPLSSATTTSFSTGWNRTFFNLDNDTLTEHLPFVVDTSNAAVAPSSYPRTLLDADANAFTTTSVEAVRSEFGTLAGFSNTIFLGSRRSAALPEELFVLEDFTATGTPPVRISYLDGATMGTGRYKVSLVGYENSAGSFEDKGNILSSPCLSLDTTADGEVTNQNFTIPYGDAADTNPMKIATRIDIYPNAEDCSGAKSHKAILFKDGIAGYLNGNSINKVKLTHGSNVSNLFIGD